MQDKTNKSKPFGTPEKQGLPNLHFCSLIKLVKSIKANFTYKVSGPGELCCEYSATHLPQVPPFYLSISHCIVLLRTLII